MSHVVGEQYESCEWIEGGVAFNRRSLHACLIVHHGAGLPYIGAYNGEEFPLEHVLAVRKQIREANKSGGHPACKGCAHLKKRRWPEPRYPIEIVGIAHFSHCNIKCNYCFLQTQDPASFVDGFRPYPVVSTIKKLIADGSLAPNAIVDWGGGEPTIYKEFDELLELLLAHGTFHYVHTNGTHLPEPMRTTPHPERVHVICSVDAGLAQTYLAMKKRDYLELVWTNLAEYIRLGAKVTLKYIMKNENCADEELDAFLARGIAIGATDLLVDIDYDFPKPTDAVLKALARLKHRALAAGWHARYGFTGENFAAELNVAERVESAFRTEQLDGVRRLLVERGYEPGECLDVTLSNLLTTLEAHCAAKDQEILRQVAKWRRVSGFLRHPLLQPVRQLARMGSKGGGALSRIAARVFL